MPVSDSARLDVDVLLAKVLGKDRTYLYIWPDKSLSVDEQRDFHNMLARREKGEPIAHIVGEKEFWSMALYVDTSTLIPRPDTEILVERALHLLPPGKSQKILDLGTGTGAIAIAIASERPDSEVLGVDNSESALALAEKNIQRHSLNNLALLHSHWFDAVAERNYDMIVSNPPYIDPRDQHLRTGDLRYEPMTALVAERHGLADIEMLVDQALNFMSENAWLVLEHGNEQGESVRQRMRRSAYTEVDTARDLNGHERVTYGRKPERDNHER